MSSLGEVAGGRFHWIGDLTVDLLKYRLVLAGGEGELYEGGHGGG